MNDFKTDCKVYKYESGKSHFLIALTELKGISAKSVKDLQKKGELPEEEIDVKFYIHDKFAPLVRELLTALAVSIVKGTYIEDSEEMQKIVASEGSLYDTQVSTDLSRIFNEYGTHLMSFIIREREEAGMAVEIPDSIRNSLWKKKHIEELANYKEELNIKKGQGLISETAVRQAIEKKEQEIAELIKETNIPPDFANGFDNTAKFIVKSIINQINREKHISTKPTLKENIMALQANPFSMNRNANVQEYDAFWETVKKEFDKQVME